MEKKTSYKWNEDNSRKNSKKDVRINENAVWGNQKKRKMPRRE